MKRKREPIIRGTGFNFGRLCPAFGCFGNETADEFFLTIEGERLPLFKPFADPRLPMVLLDESITVFDLARNPKLSNNRIINKWYNACLDNPNILIATLDFALAQALKIDEIQTRLFLSELPKATDNRERLELILGHLIAGLKLQSSTFYFAEGLVDDFSGWEFNPVKKIIGDFRVIGQSNIDALAQIGPALLQRYIRSSELAWSQDLTWENIRETARVILSSGDERSRLLGELMRLTGVSAEQILFAFEFMEYVPIRVGGKKADMTEEEAKKAFSNFKDVTNTGISGFNGLIKFLSWLPNIKISEDEPNPGLSRTYSSVRNPVETIKKFIFSSADLWRSSEEMEKFQKQMQAMGMPAAEGRAILFLLESGLISIEGLDFQRLERKSRDIIDHVQKELDKIELCERGNPTQIGGKVKGLVVLKEISKFFPEVAVPDFAVIDTIAVDKILQGFGITPSDIFTLNLRKIKKEVKNIRTKIEEGQIPDEIVKLVAGRFEGKKIALRSSSVIEDADSQTIGCGAFESVLNVNVANSDEIKRALKEVLLSNFSDRAISFRQRTGLPFMPSQLAIVVQEMAQGNAGVIFIEEDKVTINLGGGYDSVTSGSSSFTKLSLTQNPKLQRIVWILKQTFGHNLDIEFVINSKADEIKVVQLRKLVQNNDTFPVRETNQMPVVSISSLEDIKSLNISGPITLDLTRMDISTNSGEILTFLARNPNIKRIVARASPTSHLANLARQFGVSFIQAT